MTASAETVAAGASAEATVSKVDGHFNINFKIPRGASGNETIDDTAGIGDTDKVWSADKDAKEISALKSAKAPIIMESISTPADVQTFSDGADGMPVKTLTVGIEPVQDLHGYDNPWPAGGGVNILDPNLKFATQTVRGVTLTTSNGYQYSVSGTGESGSGDLKTNTIATADCVVYPAGTYTATGMLLSTYHPDGSWYSNRGGTFTSPEDFIVRTGYREIAEGTTYDTNGFISLTKGSTALTEWSPYSNICPITGHTGANVTRTGVNVWDEQWEQGDIAFSSGANISSTSYFRSINYIPVVPSTSYYLHSSKLNILFYDKSKSYLGRYTGGLLANKTNTVFITPYNAYYMRFASAVSGNNVYQNDISINYPATDTQYHPGHVQQIEYEFPQAAGTVYGGTLTIHQDGSGELVANHADLDLGTIPSWTKITTSGSHWRFYAYLNTAVPGAKLYCSNYKWITASAQYLGEQGVATQASGSNVLVMVSDEAYSDTAEFKTAMSGVHLVYELATPVTYQLTNQQVIQLLSFNNIWADTGKINAVEYPADTKLYIDGKIASLQALILENISNT